MTKGKNFIRKGGAQGFSLIEIMIVVAIIGTLAAIAVPNYIAYRDKAQMVRTITDIQLIERKIDLFVVDNDRFPVSLAEIGMSGLLDPYGNPYRYLPWQAHPGAGCARVVSWCRCMLTTCCTAWA
ncbi:MAG: prepilin-type N-terminal cleavage/methylation domain-containing protein, partial [Desulfosarcina sp.]|nr:prepilin-type N-terminal cleavage/methylation domain-containing protein [Desulfobacterales bacterium]